MKQQRVSQAALTMYYNLHLANRTEQQRKLRQVIRLRILENTTFPLVWTLNYFLISFFNFYVTLSNLKLYWKNVEFKTSIFQRKFTTKVTISKSEKLVFTVWSPQPHSSQAFYYRLLESLFIELFHNFCQISLTRMYYSGYSETFQILMLIKAF